MPSQISFEQAVREITTIVNEHPDFIYEPLDGRASSVCMYAHMEDGESTPGCIIGHWLSRFHNVPLRTLHNLEGRSVKKLLTHHSHAIGVNASDRALAFLTTLQSYQDTGHSWGRALDLALAAVALDSRGRTTVI